MVRSHIGNVVCRKALCVRVASSPPKKEKPALLRVFLFFTRNFYIYVFDFSRHKYVFHNISVLKCFSFGNFVDFHSHISK